MSEVPHTISVSCIITFHREGLLAHTTLHSILRARQYAESRGISVQCAMTLDKPDADTERIVLSHPIIQRTDVVDIVDYGDTGVSRNHAISRSAGDYLVIMDGDDYYSENFIAALAEEAAKDNNSAIYPEYIFSFDGEHHYRRLGGPREPIDNSCSLFSQNHYCSIVAAHRSVFERIPYRACESGFGFEDWHWSCEARGMGIRQRLAPGVVLFYRRSSGSMAANYARQAAIIPPSRFFQSLPKPAEALLEQPTVSLPKVSWKYAAKNMFFLFLRCFPEKFANGFYEFLRKKIARPVSNQPDYPPAVHKALLEVAAVDGMLHPDCLPPVPRIEPRYDLLPGKAYALVWNTLKEHDFDIVYLLSHVFVGGADLMAVNYMKAAAHSKKRVLCIITEDRQNELNQIPEGIEILEFGKLVRALNEEQKTMVLTRLLVQLAPSVIHAANDWFGFKLLITHGAALKSQSRLCASIYADAQDRLDIHYGAGTKFLRPLHPHCTNIINDNQVTAAEWSQRLGLPSDFFCPVYGLMPVRRDAEKHMPRKRDKVLWAGRLDKEKRLDILLAIAKAVPEMTFDVYGRSVLVADPNLDDLRKQPNVVLHGAYSSFFDLPHEEYTCLLYTTQCDGLPNILLEAASCGLPIVAPARGGVSDFVSNETGWLIERYEDIPAFVSAIRAIVYDYNEALRRSCNAQRLLRERHTFESFQAALFAAYFFETAGTHEKQ